MPGLKKEIAAYERLRDDLELEHFGEWVVVHDEKLAGIYDSFGSGSRQRRPAFRARAVPNQTSRRTTDDTADFRAI